MYYLKIEIDWVERGDWKCPFCGGDIDHLTGEPDDEHGFTEDSYTCQENGGMLCDHAFMIVRWSHTKRDPSNGDALTLANFIELHLPDYWYQDVDKASGVFQQLEPFTETKIEKPLIPCCADWDDEWDEER